MKKNSQLITLLLLAASSLFAVSSVSAQATLTWDITPGIVGEGDSAITGGTGAWNNTNGNWTSDAGANNVTWDADDSNIDIAIFNANGNNGTRTVTLGETIDLNALTFSNLRNSGPVQKYTITSGTLAFSGTAATKAITTGTSLDNVNNAEYASINSAITGAPDVKLTWSGGNNTLVFAPASGSQALGTATGPGIVKLAGSTTGNTIVGLNAASNGKIRMSSGTWTLTGTATGYEHWIEGGTLIISTGSLQNNNRATNLSAGTLHWNNAGAIKDNSISTLRDRDFNITGGSIDNTSGGAVTSSHNPQMVWGGNWTFIGSNGANSNLNMGTGQVFLNGNRQVTVTNAAATLTVGGVIANLDTTARSLTKAGAGTLELRGICTYTGATTVNAGTLKMGANNVLPNALTSTVSIGTATLDADTRTDTAGTLDVTGDATINLGSGAALAFADSKAVDWTGGTLNITGTLGATSLRFGDSADDLTPAQLALISVNGSGLGTYALDANGYLVLGGGDVTPPMLTSITDNVSGGPITIGTMVTYTVSFNEDMDATTVAASDFNNAGTAAVTIGSVNETAPGVFSVQATPTTAGSLTLRIAGPVLQDTSGNNLVVPVSDDTTITVQTAYDAWAGGALFDDDANSDGVKNGLAWILGAANPNAAALDKLPTVSTSGGNMVLTFKRIQSSINATTALSIEVGTTLTSWPSVYTVGVDTAGSTPDVVVAKDTPIAGTDTISLTLPQGSDPKKFARLKAVQTP